MDSTRIYHYTPQFSLNSPKLVSLVLFLTRDRVKSTTSRSRLVNDTITDRADCSIHWTSSLIDRVRGSTPLVLHQRPAPSFGRGSRQGHLRHRLQSRPRGWNRCCSQALTGCHRPGRRVQRKNRSLRRHVPA